jgi:hypothetical protein
LDIIGATIALDTGEVHILGEIMDKIAKSAIVW